MLLSVQMSWAQAEKGEMSTRESRALMAEVYPAVPIRGEINGFDTLLSIDKARSHLGYEPQHSWRDYVSAG